MKPRTLHVHLLFLAWCAYFAGLRYAQGDQAMAVVMILLSGILYVLTLELIQSQVRTQVDAHLQFIQKALQALADSLTKASTDVAKRAAKGGDA